MHPEKGSGWQAGVQMSGIVVTLLFAIVGGTITGLSHKTWQYQEDLKVVFSFWFHLML